MNTFVFWGLLLSLTILSACGGGNTEDREDENGASETVISSDNGANDEGNTDNTNTDTIDGGDNTPTQICQPGSTETLSCASEIPNALTATQTQTCATDGLSFTESSCQVLSCQTGFEISGNTCIASQNTLGSYQERFLTYLGGSEYERIQGVFIDDAGYIYLAGTTGSPDFPTTAGAFQENKPSPSGANLEQTDGFVAKLLPDAQGIVWATYLGASRRESAYGVKVDSNGNVYVSGTTGSPDFPTTDGSTHNGPFGNNYLSDIFITKFDASGTVLFSTLVGGTQGTEENPRASMLVDEINHRIYVSGVTSAPDFPIVDSNNAAQATFAGGGFDAFVFAMADDGSRLIASTFIGGRGADMAFTSLAQHSDGSIIVGGATNSDDFPVTSGAYQTNFAGQTPNQRHWEQGGDAFAVRISPDLDRFIYSTYFGGSGTDTVCHNQGVAINSQNQGVFYVNVQSQDFPTTTGNQTLSGAADTAVVILSEDGSAIVSSTLVGGNGFDYASGIDVGSDDRVYVSGSTDSTNFPVSSNPFQQTKSSGTDAFLTVLEPDLDQVYYSTYFGGSDDDAARGLWVNSNNQVIVGGVSASTNMPLVNPGLNQSYSGGSKDAILFGLEEQP